MKRARGERRKKERNHQRIPGCARRTLRGFRISSSSAYRNRAAYWSGEREEAEMGRPATRRASVGGCQSLAYLATSCIRYPQAGTRAVQLLANRSEKSVKPTERSIVRAARNVRKKSLVSRERARISATQEAQRVSRARKRRKRKRKSSFNSRLICHTRARAREKEHRLSPAVLFLMCRAT